MMTMMNLNIKRRRRMRNDQRVIYKYRLQDGGETKIKGWFTRMMHVGEQNGELYIWMENSLTRTDFYTGQQVPRDDSEKIEISVYAIGTGWPYAAAEFGVHVGTVQMSDGLVWHVFIHTDGQKWVQT